MTPSHSVANTSNRYLDVELWNAEELSSIAETAGAGVLSSINASRGSCFKAGFSASHPTKRLEFIHIPRNAGTSVEMCSNFDKSREPEDKWGVANPNIRGLYAMPRPDVWGVPWPPKCYKQHVPPAYLPDVYDGKETFCVVRDPYSRMVSQFKYISVHSKTLDDCSAATMNAALLSHLTKAKEESPYFGDCHYLPQSVFVYDIDPATAKTRYRQRGCKNILHLEKLNEQFDALMASHGYPYELLPHNKAGGTVGPESCDARNKNELSQEVRRLIEEIHADDFKHFGYPKM